MLLYSKVLIIHQPNRESLQDFSNYSFI